MYPEQRHRMRWKETKQLHVNKHKNKNKAIPYFIRVWTWTGSVEDGSWQGLQKCKSFVEMCIVICLSASPACVCGRGAATWGCPRRRLPCRRDSPAPLYRTSGWLSFGWL
jgi:hypothetical protein